MPERVVIIGSGPAGWTAAIYAARANLKPLVIAGDSSGTDRVPGGQLMYTTDVENYPGFPEGLKGPKMMELFRAQAERFGTRVIESYVTQVDFKGRPLRITHANELRDTEPETVEAHAVIIATGATANWLGLENEQRLARSGGGVSACAICDGAFYPDKIVAVMGGGDSACEEANYLTKYARKVYVIHRRDELRASKIMQQRVLKNRKIEVLWNKIVVDVLGDERISGVKLKDTKTGEESKLPVEGLFLAIGHTPATAFLQGQVETDKKGYIKLKDSYRSTTSAEGVFAAGDVTDSVYRQAVTAAGMGCKAAIDAERWLAEQGIE
jgi:thioredoxin reductase (NADPH)